MTFTQKFYQVRNRILREIFKTPVFQVPSELAYKAALEKYVGNLPVLSPNDLTLVDILRCEGIVVTSLEALAIPSTPLVLNAQKKYYQQYQDICLAIKMNMLFTLVQLKLWSILSCFSGG